MTELEFVRVAVIEPDDAGLVVSAAVVLMTSALLTPREPVAPGVGRVRTAAFVLSEVKLIEPPFKTSEVVLT